MVQSEEVLQGSGIASVASTYHNGISRLIRENDAWWSTATTSIEADFGVMVQATLLAAQELMGRKATEMAVLQPRIRHFATTLEIAFTAATSLEKHYTTIQSHEDIEIVHRFGATISATLNQVQHQTGEATKQTETNQHTHTDDEDTDEQEPFSNEGSIANIFSDAANPGLKDHLDFESDYIALASVIAYRKFQPPLAVGLFGNWGSGKSFFMSKLQGEISKLTDTESPTYDPNYCERIVQINFNSWHYSDSNLWASLITKIFEDLEKCGTKDEEKTQLEILFNNLSSSRELKLESEKELRKVEKEIEKLEQQHAAVENEITDQVQNLESMNTLDIVKAVLNDDSVRKDIAELKKEYSFVRSDSLEDIRKNLDTLETTQGKLVESFRILYSYRKGDLWIALTTAIAVFIGSSYLVNQVPIVKAWFAEMRLLIVPFLVGLSQALLYVKRGVPYVDELHRRLLSLKKKTDELEIQERNKFNVHRDNIQRKIDHAQLLANTLKEKVKDLELKAAEAEHEMNTIASGKKMIGFIEGRVTDQRYINSLGIISWIRKDFEELDFLLKQQHDARKLQDALVDNKVKDVFKVDRIVLYIDDLDRCDVSVVVRVLEAIHLLLAFPLFVVVVGVDPRWMHNALQQKYKDFLATGSADNKAELSAELREIAALGQSATSFDYLEKIFQIPFVLKPIDIKGKRKLIEANLTDDHFDTVPDIHLHHIMPSLASAATIAEDPTTAYTGTVVTDPTTSGLSEQQITASKERRALTSLVSVSDEEIAFMQCLTFLVGDSPRTIKRFVNIYRLIRAHARFRFTDANRGEHYYAAMVILGILTNYPDNARHFFDFLRRQKDNTPFGKAHQDYTEIRRDKPFPLKCWQEVPTEAAQILKNITLSKFKVNLDLISRFSFRNVMEDL